MSTSNGYRDAIKDDESLRLFLDSMSEFNRAFCDRWAIGDVFTLKLELHGNRGELLLVREHNDGFKRPPGVENRVLKKSDRRM